jgi:glycosyltransferase involved in cell wall biosynthesis
MNGSEPGIVDPSFVSVVLPTFNGRDRIAAAIESVLSQDHEQLEVLVIDDASTDDTHEVVRRIGDPRLRYMRLEANAGPYVARDLAITEARGKLIAFIDDDDVWLPGKLRRQVALLTAQPEVSLVHSAVRDVFPGGATRLRRLHRKANDYRENLCQDRLATSTVVARRSAIQDAGGFDTSLRAFGDWDLWLRVLREHRAAGIDDPLATINLRPGSIQRGSVEAFERSRKAVLDKHGDELKRLGLERRAMSLHHYAVAAKLHLAGRSSEARSRLFDSMRQQVSPEALALLAITFLKPETSHWARLQFRRARSMLRL